MTINESRVHLLLSFCLVCLTTGMVIVLRFYSEEETISQFFCNSFPSIYIAGQSVDKNVKPVERTLILLKPNAVQQRLVGKIIERFENRGLKLVAMKTILANEQILDKHYHQHKNRPFRDEIVEFMASGLVVPMIWEGPNAVVVTRNMIGYYDPLKSEPSTIRGDFSLDITENVIHGSDSVESAKREIKLWFQDNEM